MTFADADADAPRRKRTLEDCEADPDYIVDVDDDDDDDDDDDPLHAPLPANIATVRDYQCSGLTRSYEVVRKLFEREVVALRDVKNKSSAYMLNDGDGVEGECRPQFVSQRVLSNLFRDLFAYSRVHGRVVPETRPGFIVKYLNDPLRKVYRCAEIFPLPRRGGRDDDDDDDLEVYNLWRGYRFDGDTPLAEGDGEWVAVAIQKFDAALDVLAGHDPRKKHYVLDWLCAAFERPWTKRRVAIVFEARERAGMRLIHSVMKLLRAMLGDHATTITDSPTLHTQLNDRLLSKTFFCVAELFSVSRHFVNALVDDVHVPVMRKCATLFNMRSCHQFLFSCKEHVILRDYISVDPRFYLVSCAHDSPEELLERRRADIEDMRHDLPCLRTIYWWLRKGPAGEEDKGKLKVNVKVKVEIEPYVK